MKHRIKHCVVCKVNFSAMYRVQYKKPKEWVFICKECLIDVKKDNTNYTYGGTWKRWCNLLQFKFILSGSLSTVLKLRIKHCAICNVDFSTMYRVQYKNQKNGYLFVTNFSLTLKRPYHYE